MFETSVAVQTTANAFWRKGADGDDDSPRLEALSVCPGIATVSVQGRSPILFGHWFAADSPPTSANNLAEPNSRHEETLSVGLQIVRGHVDSIARAINVSNAQPNTQGVADVNPIFTWVRLAQRIPVRVHIDEVPPDVVLAAGMTATVEIDSRSRERIGALGF